MRRRQVVRRCGADRTVTEQVQPQWLKEQAVSTGNLQGEVELDQYLG